MKFPVIKKWVSLFIGMAAMCSVSIYANPYDPKPDQQENSAFKQVERGYYVFNKNNPTVKQQGLATRYGDQRYKVMYYGRTAAIKVFVPATFANTFLDRNAQYPYYTDPNAASAFRTGVHGNRNANDFKRGSSGEGFISTGYNPNGGHVMQNGVRGEFRYIGYLSDGSLVHNPYFPDDVNISVDSWDKRWQKFGARTSAGRTHTATILNRTENTAKQVFELFIQEHPLGQELSKKRYNGEDWTDWRTWNKYFAIQTESESLTYQITGFHNHNGSIYYQSFLLPRPINASTYLTGVRIVNDQTQQVVDKSEIFFIEGETSGFSKNTLLYQGLRSWALNDHRARAFAGKGWEPLENLGVIKYGEPYTLESDVKYFNKKDGVTPLGGARMNLIVAWINEEGDVRFQPEDAATNISSYPMNYKGTLVSNNPQPTKTTFSIQPLDDKTFVPVEMAISVYLDYDLITNGDDFTSEDNDAFIRLAVDTTGYPFLTPQDMGLSQEVILENPEGIQTNELTLGMDNTLKFKVLHKGGTDAVGLDPVLNPKATIDVVVKDANNKNLINKSYLASEVLNPGGEVVIPIPRINTTTHKITATATINAVHEAKGYNLANGNDTVTATFVATKNYSIRDLVVTPSLVMPPAGVTSINQPLNFIYTLTNETSGTTTNNPLVVLTKDNSEIWRGNVPIRAGETKTVSLPIVTNLSKNSLFKLTVNPNRTEIEVKRNMPDPYSDNSKTTSVTFKPAPSFGGCTVNRTLVNNWTERITFSKRYANTSSYMSHNCSKDKDGKTIHDACYPVSYCPTSRTDSKHVDHAYNERYQIQKIEARSKWSIDNASRYSHIQGDGWANVTNNALFRVKAGYPIEIRVTSNYRTNRNMMPTQPALASGSCYNSAVTISDIPVPKMLNRDTFVKMPNTGNHIKLSTTSLSSEWFNATAVRELPLRPTLSGKDNKPYIYVGRNTSPGVYQVEVFTDVNPGYQPTNVQSGSIRNLQDCRSFAIEVLVNNDIGSHIVD